MESQASQRHTRTVPSAWAGIDYETAKKTAARMADTGQLHRDSGGRYRDPTTPEVSPVSLLSPEES
jgi:hypothetical protein